MRRLTAMLSMAAALAGSTVPAPAGAGAKGASSEAAAPAPRFVREAQRALRDLGYQPGPADGVVGPRTKAALAAYQRSEKIAVTGRLDSETMVRLDIQKRLFQGQARAR
jgi:murein L,D-transpeptidase YcbB/YkuD